MTLFDDDDLYEYIPDEYNFNLFLYMTWILTGIFFIFGKLYII